MSSIPPSAGPTSTQPFPEGEGPSPAGLLRGKPISQVDVDKPGALGNTPSKAHKLLPPTIAAGSEPSERATKSIFQDKKVADRTEKQEEEKESDSAEEAAGYSLEGFDSDEEESPKGTQQEQIETSQEEAASGEANALDDEDLLAGFESDEMVSMEPTGGEAAAPPADHAATGASTTDLPPAPQEGGASDTLIAELREQQLSAATSGPGALTGYPEAARETGAAAAEKRDSGGVADVSSEWYEKAQDDTYDPFFDQIDVEISKAPDRVAHALQHAASEFAEAHGLEEHRSITHQDGPFTYEGRPGLNEFFVTGGDEHEGLSDKEFFKAAKESLKKATHLDPSVRRILQRARLRRVTAQMQAFTKANAQKMYQQLQLQFDEMVQQRLQEMQKEEEKEKKEVSGHEPAPHRIQSRPRRTTSMSRRERDVAPLSAPSEKSILEKAAHHMLEKLLERKREDEKKRREEEDEKTEEVKIERADYNKKEDLKIDRKKEDIKKNEDGKKDRKKV